MSENRPVVKFCPECGKPTMPGMMFCTNCGAKLPVLPVQESTKPVEVKKTEPQKQTVNPVSQPSVTQQNTNVSKVQPAAENPTVKPEEPQKAEPKPQPVKPVETAKPVTDTSNTQQAPQQNVVKPAETKIAEPQPPVSTVQPAVQNAVKPEEPVKQSSNVSPQLNAAIQQEVKKEEPQKQVVEPRKQEQQPPVSASQPAVQNTVKPEEPVKQTTNVSPQPNTVNQQEAKKAEPQKQTVNAASQTNPSDPNVLHYTYTAQGTQQTNGAQGAPQVTVSVPYNQPYNNPSYMNQYQMQMEYKPISAWGYLGYELLFLLPVVGWIIMIIMCFAPANKNVKNFARAHVILYIILIVLVIIIVAAAGASLDYLFSQFSL